MPHLRTYWNQLKQVLDDNSQSNALLQQEAYQVFGSLLQAAGCLLKSKQQGVPMTSLGFQVNNSHPVLRSNLSPWAGTSVIQHPAPVASTRSRSSSSGLASNSLQLYQQLYDVFGDSLAPRVAHNNWQDAAVTKNNQMRMQPFAHAYYPLRPLGRDAHVIKELISKAKERLQVLSSPIHTSKRKRTDDEDRSGMKTADSKRPGHRSKRICLTLRPARAKLTLLSTDIAPNEPSSSRNSRRSSHCTVEPTKKVAKVFQKHSKRTVATGRIRRKFRKTNFPLNSKAKYDYHMGVML